MEIKRHQFVVLFLRMASQLIVAKNAAWIRLVFYVQHASKSLRIVITNIKCPHRKEVKFNNLHKFKDAFIVSVVAVAIAAILRHGRKSTFAKIMRPLTKTKLTVSLLMK